jgi:hypothetical protein
MPLVLWITIALFRQHRFAAWKPLAVIGMIALMLNIGHYGRNYQLFGSPLLPDSVVPSYRNDRVSLPLFISNVSRNIASQTSLPPFNFIALGIVNLTHDLLNLSVNDSANTFKNSDFAYFMSYRILVNNRSEGMAGNPLHSFLLLPLAATIFLKRSHLDNCFWLTMYGMAMLGTFVLFSLVFKWQPWGSRLLLPFFVMLCPWIAVVLSSMKDEKIIHYLFVTLLLVSLPWVVLNKTRPLIGVPNIITGERTSVYFWGHQPIESPYRQAIGYITQAGCTQIGLFIGGDDYEYPFWVLMKEHGITMFRMEHVHVTNESSPKNKMLEGWEPCVIIDTDIERDLPREQIFSASSQTEFDTIKVYLFDR